MTEYENMTSEYSKHRGVHPEVRRKLLVVSGIGSSSKVLEVGCGTGYYIIALEALTGCLAWGVDPSEQMLSVARGRSRAISFNLGKAESLNFKQDFFDLVFSVDVIHHVGSPSAYFLEAHRVLRPGGKVCTVTDSEMIIRNRQPLAIYFPETVEADLGRYPRITELREFMEEVGFEKITENIVELAYQLTEIEAYRNKAFSVLYLISEEAFQNGIRRMEQDLRKGPIQGVSRYLLLWGTK